MPAQRTNIFDHAAALPYARAVQLLVPSCDPKPARTLNKLIHDTVQELNDLADAYDHRRIPTRRVYDAAGLAAIRKASKLAFAVTAEDLNNSTTDDDAERPAAALVDTEGAAANIKSEPTTPKLEPISPTANIIVDELDGTPVSIKSEPITPDLTRTPDVAQDVADLDIAAAPRSQTPVTNALSASASPNSLAWYAELDRRLSAAGLNDRFSTPPTGYNTDDEQAAELQFADVNNRLPIASPEVIDDTNAVTIDSVLGFSLPLPTDNDHNDPLMISPIGSSMDCVADSETGVDFDLDEWAVDVDGEFIDLAQQQAESMVLALRVLGLNVEDAARLDRIFRNRLAYRVPDRFDFIQDDVPTVAGDAVSDAAVAEDVDSDATIDEDIILQDTAPIARSVAARSPSSPRRRRYGAKVFIIKHDNVVHRVPIPADCDLGKFSPKKPAAWIDESELKLPRKMKICHGGKVFARVDFRRQKHRQLKIQHQLRRAEEAALVKQYNIPIPTGPEFDSDMSDADTSESEDDSGIDLSYFQHTPCPVRRTSSKRSFDEMDNETDEEGDVPMLNRDVTSSSPSPVDRPARSDERPKQRRRLEPKRSATAAPRRQPYATRSRKSTAAATATTAATESSSGRMHTRAYTRKLQQSRK